MCVQCGPPSQFSASEPSSRQYPRRAQTSHARHFTHQASESSFLIAAESPIFHGVPISQANNFHSTTAPFIGTHVLKEIGSSGATSTWTSPRFLQLCEGAHSTTKHTVRSPASEKNVSAKMLLYFICRGKAMCVTLATRFSRFPFHLRLVFNTSVTSAGLSLCSLPLRQTPVSLLDLPPVRIILPRVPRADSRPNCVVAPLHKFLIVRL